MADTKVELIMLAQHNENDDLDVVVERANNIELKLSTTELANAGVQGIATQESGSYSICGEFVDSTSASKSYKRSFCNAEKQLRKKELTR